MELRFCRICGKKGIKFASDGCKYCGSSWIDNIEWQIKKREGLTEVINGIEVLRKKSSKEVFKENINYVNKNTWSAISPILFWSLLILLICSFWAIVLTFFW